MTWVLVYDLCRLVDVAVCVSFGMMDSQGGV